MALANALLNIDMITTQFIVELKNRMVFGNLIDRQWDSTVSTANFNGTIRIRRPVYYASTAGPDITGDIEDTIQQNATLTLDQNPVVPLQFTQNELTLEMADFTNRIISPAVDRIAQDVESAIAEAAANNFAFLTGTPGTPPSTSVSVGTASAILSDAGVPVGDRWGCYAPQAALNISDNLKSLFSQPNARSGLEESKMGRIHRLNLHESASVVRHTNGHFTTGSTPDINGAAQETTYAIDGDNWSQSLITSGWGGSGTVKKGDHFTIAGVFSVNRATNQSTGQLQQFIVNADQVDTAADMVINISPPIILDGAYQTCHTASGTLADALLLTFIGVEDAEVTQNIVAHRNAITIGFAELAPPAGGQKFSRKVMDNVSMAITSDYNINTAVNTWRVETLFGVAVQNPMMGVIHTG